MYRISELAEQVGLSRTTLLYYEKLGLIEGQRLDNGYRIYSDRDEQRVRLIQQLQAGGLTLKECKACLNAKVERQILLNRLQQLDEEIAKKQQSRQLLAALLGESGLKEWHESIDKIAPNAHLDWLIKQGFNEKEALRLKWLSKDMNEHEQYMTDFNHIFDGLDRLGPGTEAETLKALRKVPFSPQTLMEVGCGKGIATTVLAKNSFAMITAVDNDEPALERLTERLADAGLADRVTTQCASMTDLPFEAASFDVIWAEGSAYIMGVTNAMEQWRSLLTDGGVLVISDLVWQTKNPSADVQAFWQKEYPDMTTTAKRIEQAQAAGYQVLDTFTLSEAAWKAYFMPLQTRVDALKSEMQDSTALRDIEVELNIYRQSLDEFGYQMFILKNSRC
ncbi:MerR family transcriptional regulator [Photobacterium sp. SDRW27]|uniref:MerR family transcriptional regulator n=1 Tax=Photobacterium obscurum TaxID=2829490 RepID=UPI002243EA10|nr:MerR family transcriptional regulator [Photobacterium obscurum]MCW8330851.1 MerR family transcriptional regulator [Photobacterium obscurum]